MKATMLTPPPFCRNSQTLESSSCSPSYSASTLFPFHPPLKVRLRFLYFGVLLPKVFSFEILTVLCFCRFMGSSELDFPCGRRLVFVYLVVQSTQVCFFIFFPFSTFLFFCIKFYEPISLCALFLDDQFSQGDTASISVYMTFFPFQTIQ